MSILYGLVYLRANLRRWGSPQRSSPPPPKSQRSENHFNGLLQVNDNKRSSFLFSRPWPKRQTSKNKTQTNTYVHIYNLTLPFRVISLFLSQLFQFHIFHLHLLLLLRPLSLSENPNRFLIKKFIIFSIFFSLKF